MTRRHSFHRDDQDRSDAVAANATLVLVPAPGFVRPSIADFVAPGVDADGAALQPMGLLLGRLEAPPAEALGVCGTLSATGAEVAEEARVLVETEKGVAEAEDAEREEELDTLGHVKSKSGVVLSVDPTIPKGSGIGLGAVSCRVYHQVLMFPKREQPTSSQYFFALSMLGTALFRVAPDMGHPVSHTHRGFP